MELQAPAVPHRARRYRVAAVVRLMIAAKPKVLLVPDAVVCQYQFTPVGGLVVRVISVLPQF